MRPGRLALGTVGAALLLFDLRAAASGLSEQGDDIVREPEATLSFHLALRTRYELLYNLDLDRGLTPSGEPIFPVPLRDPQGQVLTHGDMRVRANLAAIAPEQGIALRLEVDALDNLALGSLPEGDPATTTGQRAPESAVRIKRAYAEVLTPFGLLSAGRMPSHWGLGILTHAGDCDDCDAGDAADRVSFATPIAQHVWAVAYDFSAIGPTVDRPGKHRALDIEPSDDARTFTFAAMNVRTDEARKRRRRTGRISVEYGAYVSHRWQRHDAPASYLPIANPVPITQAQFIARDLRATAVDTWVRVTLPRARVEFEGALVWGSVGQASVLPGALLRDSVRTLAWGGALETDLGREQSTFGGGFDVGVASGDPAPGFGAQSRSGDLPPSPGDLDGPQASPPHDNRVDNFRFHPEVRIDRILFREIIGTVTDAAYVRPHIRYIPLRGPRSRLLLELAAVGSLALEANSTPGHAVPLGVEIDPTVALEISPGFRCALEYAFLMPLGGFKNDSSGMNPKPAQLLRTRLGFVY